MLDKDCGPLSKVLTSVGKAWTGSGQRGASAGNPHGPLGKGPCKWGQRSANDGQGLWTLGQGPHSGGNDLQGMDFGCHWYGDFPACAVQKLHHRTKMKS